MPYEVRLPRNGGSAYQQLHGVYAQCTTHHWDARRVIWYLRPSCSPLTIAATTPPQSKSKRNQGVTNHISVTKAHPISIQSSIQSWRYDRKCKIEQVQWKIQWPIQGWQPRATLARWIAVISIRSTLGEWDLLIKGKQTAT